MKKYIFIILLQSFLLEPLLIFSQTNPPQTCNVSSISVGQMQANEEFIKSLNNKSRLSGEGSVITYIPIKPHIYQYSNGTGGTTLEALNRNLAALNAYFINSRIQFYFCGTSVDYINNDTYATINETNINSAGFQDTYFNDKNAINLLSPINGPAQGALPSSQSNCNPSNVVYVPSGSLKNFTYIMVHEFGHYFNLYHTHDRDFGQELVTRLGGANCSTTGDLLCDTPADPFGLPGTPAAFGVDCSYSGTLRDANGDLYHPPTDNIMSYYYPDCLTNLTMGQYDRIVGGLQIRQNAVCPADLGLNSYDFSCPSTTLTAPNNLLVSKTSQRINLTWVDNSVNELGFIIERSLSQTSDFKAIAGVAPNVTSYSDTTAISGNTYYYRLKASNTTNNYSSIAILAASNCPINQNLSMEVTGGSTLLFSASSAINSTSSISGVGTNVTYKASSIELNVGFGVEAGSLFESFVQPCSSSNLRESAEPIMVKMEESSGNIYAYPNPSRNKEFIIEYELAEPSFISLSLINFMGQQMKTIVDNQFEGNGIHHVFVEAKNLDAGNYICVLKSSKETKIKRIIID